MKIESNISGTVHTTDPTMETRATQTTTIGSMTSVSKVFRFLGALLVVAATSTFMLQQWHAGDSVTRYLTLLAMTVSLVAAGVFCGVGVRESRGARTFFALVIAAIPVHFAVLGGLLQSQLPWDHFTGVSAPWNAESLTTALWLTGAGIAVLIPCIHLSMLTLVRPCARTLTAAYAAVNLMLLVPIRDPDLVAWLVAALFAFVAWFEHRAPAASPALRTGEGVYVRAALTVPTIVMVGRTALWYEPTFAFAGLVLLAAGSACFAWSRAALEDTASAGNLQAVSSVGAVVGCILIDAALLDAITVPAELAFLLLTLPAAALLLTLSRWSVSGGSGHRMAAAALAVAASTANLIVFWDPSHVSVSGLVCLVVGVLFVALGVHRKQLVPLTLGIVGVAAAIVHFMVAAIEVEKLMHWGTLAASGVLLIFAAAVFDRYAQRIIALAGALGDGARDWRY